MEMADKETLPEQGQLDARVYGLSCPEYGTGFKADKHRALRSRTGAGSQNMQKKDVCRGTYQASLKTRSGDSVDGLAVGEAAGKSYFQGGQRRCAAVCSPSGGGRWFWKGDVGSYGGSPSNPFAVSCAETTPSQTGGGNGGWATIEGQRVVDSCT
jgi:hypothetical protein